MRGDNMAAGTASLQVGEHLVSDTDKENRQEEEVIQKSKATKVFFLQLPLPSLP